MAYNTYEKVKEWRTRRKAKLVAAFGGRCGQCNVEDHQVVYDFHHLDPSKKETTISSKVMNWKSVVIEAEKCVMLCCSCHRKYHAGVLELKDDLPRFDESLIPESLSYDTIMRESMRTAQKAKTTRIAWETMDIAKMMKDNDNKIGRVANQLGVSWKAVRRQVDLLS